jgi:hypothetical protein
MSASNIGSELASVMRKYMTALPANPTTMKILRLPFLSDSAPQITAKIMYASISTVTKRDAVASVVLNWSITNSFIAGAMRVRLSIEKNSSIA